MLQITINNIQIDIVDGQNLSTDTTLFSLKNGSERYLSTSQKIGISDTRNNRRIFNSPLNTLEEKLDFNKIYDCEIRQDELNLRGTVILLKYAQNLGGSISLSNILSKEVRLFKDKIRDVLRSTIDSYDFVFDISNYNTLKELTDNIWCWRFAETTNSVINSEPNNNNDLKFQRPAFRLQSILNTVAEQLNITFSLDKSRISEYERLILTSFHSEFLLSNYEKIFLDTTDALTVGETQITELDINNYQNSGVTSTDLEIKLPVNKEVKVVLRIDNVELIGNLDIIVRTDNFEYIERLENGEVYVDTGFIDPDSNADRQISLFFNSENGANFKHVNMRIYTILKDEKLPNFDPNGYVVKTYENLEYTTSEILNVVFGFFSASFIINENDRDFKFQTFNEIILKNEIQKFDVNDKVEITPHIGGKKNTLGYDNDETINIHSGESFFYNIGDLEDTKSYIKLNFSASVEVKMVAQIKIFNNAGDERIVTKRRVLYANDSSESASFKHFSFTEVDFVRLHPKYHRQITKALTNGRVATVVVTLNSTEIQKIIKGNIIKMEGVNHNIFPLSIKGVTVNLYRIKGLILY